MNLSLKRCLIPILQAMIVSWSVNILKLASEYASRASVASVVRRIERFLLRGLIKQHEAARGILAALPANGRFILSMDGTSWQLGKFKYYVLAVGICFNGISLPICLSFLPGHDITSFVEEIGIMERVVSLIGRERIECLLADREFGNSNFIKWLQINQAQLPEKTCFIFTTAYLRYALEGFDIDAVDYLHKPFSYNRSQTAFSKALRRIGCRQLPSASQCITVKQDYNIINIPIDDILYIEAIEGYSKIFRVSGDCIMSRILLRNIFALLPKDYFIRIHRSFIVSRLKIKSFNKQEVILRNGASLPVGRQYASEFSAIMSR